MDVLFYIAAIIAALASLFVVIGRNAVHALLYLIVSLLAVALIFLTLGAPFAAALEIIIYAGAIMVLFVFVIMMLNIGPGSAKQESQWLSPKAWAGPGVLVLILAVELLYVLTKQGTSVSSPVELGPKQIGIALFGPYVLGVELASVLLLAGLVGAYHLGRPHKHGKEGNT